MNNEPISKIFDVLKSWVFALSLRNNSEDISKSWYEELERDIPGIDSTVIELLKTQILGLCYF